MRSEANVTHGHTRQGEWSSEYVSWKSMKQRCLNKNNPNYKYYGGRGITICDSWVNSFSKFLEDMGPKPFQGATLDRIKNEKGYYFGNCRWLSQSDQCKNKGDYRNNTSGYTGVSFHKKTGKWQARYYVDGKRKQLGLFPSAIEAHEAKIADGENRMSTPTEDVITVNTNKCFEVFSHKSEDITIVSSYNSAFKSGFHCGMLYKNIREVKQIPSTELIREMNDRFSGSVLNDLHICKVLDTIPHEKVKAYLNNEL